MGAHTTVSLHNEKFGWVGTTEDPARIYTADVVEHITDEQGKRVETHKIGIYDKGEPGFHESDGDYYFMAVNGEYKACYITSDDGYTVAIPLTNGFSMSRQSDDPAYSYCRFAPDAVQAYTSLLESNPEYSLPQEPAPETEPVVDTAPEAAPGEAS